MTETELKQAAVYKTYAEWNRAGYRINAGERSHAVINGRYVFSAGQVSRRGPVQLWFAGFNTGAAQPHFRYHDRINALQL